MNCNYQPSVSSPDLIRGSIVAQKQMQGMSRLSCKLYAASIVEILVSSTRMTTLRLVFTMNLMLKFNTKGYA